MSHHVSRREFLKAGTVFMATSLLDRGLRGALGKAPRRAYHLEQRPNILIIVFDALSAGHMSLYGYPRRTTPNIERFAERATVFHRHYAAANFTTPGVASLVTGTYPWTHRAFNHAGTMIERCREQNLFSALASEGYHTIAYSHNQLADSILNQCSDHIKNHLPYTHFSLYAGEISDGLLRDDADVVWRSFEDLILQRGENAPSSLFLSLPDRLRMALHRRIRVRPYSGSYPRGLPALFKMTFRMEDIIEGIERVVADAPEPFLGYFHLLPPHEPYMPHQDFVGRFNDGWESEPKPESVFTDGLSSGELNEFRRHYDEFLAYADDRFGRLMAFLDDRRFENTVVVFTADHGQLFERGIHGHVTPTLYEPLIHVPLLISMPGQSTRQDVYSPTSCTDLVPTLLSTAGFAPPDWCEGETLSLSGEHAEVERATFAMEAKGNPKQAPLESATFAVMTRGHKLIHYLGYEDFDDVSEVYDLSQDPEERVDLWSDQPLFASQLHTLLAEQIRDH